MEEQSVANNEIMNNTSTTEYGGFWKRFIAYFIDLLVSYILIFIIMIIFGHFAEQRGHEIATIDNFFVEKQFLFNVTCMTALVLYYVLFECSPLQATPGKLCLGMRVTTMELQTVSFGRSLMRNLLKVFSVVTLLIGFFMAGFTPRKQALHDMMSGCLVVDKPEKND